VNAVIKEDGASRVYKIFKRKMAKYGRYVSIPKNVDRQKTYSWRYIVRFTNVLEENDLMEQAPSVIEAVVQDAKKRGTLRRNFTILNIRGKLLEIYEKKLQVDVENMQKQLMMVSVSHDFFTCKVGDQDPVEVLLRKQDHFGYTNLARWYDAKYLSAFYVAVSKSCRTAIEGLSRSDRSLLPTDLQLYKLLYVAAKSESLAPKLKEILGPEFAG
jgi:hypothetical protein